MIGPGSDKNGKKEIVRKRYFVSTCSTEKSPLDSILLQEVSSAAQESAHPKTNDITRISPPPPPTLEVLFKFRNRQIVRVPGNKRPGYSGSGPQTSLGQTDGLPQGLGTDEPAQVFAEQHMVSLLDLTTPAGRPRCHRVSQQSSRIRELPLFLPLLRHNEISFSVSRSTNLIAMLSYLGKPN